MRGQHRSQIGDRPLVVAGNYDHTLYCLDAATGEPLWRFTTGGPIYAAPVFFHDGARAMLFAASNDRIVYAIDPASGRQIWVHAVEDYRPTLGGARLASPCVGGAGDVPEGRRMSAILQSRAPLRMPSRWTAWP